MSVTTSLTVSFSDAGGDGPVLRLENETGVKPPYGTAYARLFKSAGVTPTLYTTGEGGVQYVNYALTEPFTGVINFSGQIEQQFQHPTLSDVQFLSQGIFLDLMGKVIPQLGLTVNTKAGTIRASQPCYGYVLVTYTTTFSRLSTKHAALSGTGLIDTADLATEFVPVTIIAMYEQTATSVTVSPPSLQQKDRVTYSFNDKSDNPRLVMELDPQFPVVLAPNGGGLTARAVFYVYPGDAGPVLNSEQNVSIAVAGFTPGVPAVNPGTSLPMVESMSFTNSQSQSLKYPPVGSITVTATSNFKNQFGTQFTPYFVAGGGSVNTVNWIDENKYVLTGTRPVRTNEVVACMNGNIVVPCTGTVRVNYSTTRERYVAEWDRPSDIWFQPIVIGAESITGLIGELKIEPPVRRGLV
jgi:hypothetical protein